MGKLHKTTIKLTKIEVAERQLASAIRLFFGEQDPVSVHTLGHAALQVVTDVARKKGIVIPFEDAIVPHRRKDWFTAVHKSRNFFKHADRDAEQCHEFVVETNHFVLFQAIWLFVRLDHMNWLQRVFLTWFLLKYPQMIVECELKDLVLRTAAELNIGPGDMSAFRMMLDSRDAFSRVMSKPPLPPSLTER